ncbi:MAG: hypothetical protein DCF31_10630 [Alphaproteobacteria bacterium]|nr:MAG: hypothetical protein DCF31_10630 [Alphaproteobacteria bacterium]
MKANVTVHEPETVLATARARVAWLLDNPGTSAWLKASLQAADGHDPISIQNDIQLLLHVIAPLASCPIEVAMRPLSLAACPGRKA